MRPSLSWGGMLRPEPERRTKGSFESDPLPREIHHRDAPADAQPCDRLYMTLCAVGQPLRTSVGGRRKPTYEGDLRESLLDGAIAASQLAAEGFVLGSWQIALAAGRVLFLQVLFLDVLDSTNELTCEPRRKLRARGHSSRVRSLLDTDCWAFCPILMRDVGHSDLLLVRHVELFIAVPGTIASAGHPRHPVR